MAKKRIARPNEERRANELIAKIKKQKAAKENGKETAPVLVPPREEANAER
ncbi:MAG TPA: hypothetical protein VMG31_03600 [Verrucomicrobiae bacterium]|nr:hypothetical protein [Verrucomicrobiae bacterium]